MPLKNIKGDLKNGLEKKYADKLVSSLFILVAKIKNNGDLSIRNYDIINPIKIFFPEKIIECTVIEENPDNINVHLTRKHEENSVECNFELLNPGDYFTLKFISSERLSIPTITARIDSLSRISTSNFEVDYSSLNPIHRNLKRFLHMIKEVNLSRPISTFTVPGIFILIGSLFMGSQALRTFAMGGALYFGPTMLIILLTFIGAFMVLIGLLLHLISFYRKSRSKNKNY